MQLRNLLFTFAVTAIAQQASNGTGAVGNGTGVAGGNATTPGVPAFEGSAFSLEVGSSVAVFAGIALLLI